MISYIRSYWLLLAPTFTVKMLLDDSELEAVLTVTSVQIHMGSCEKKSIFAFWSVGWLFSVHIFTVCR